MERACKRRGFTLIEMLVVIGIIAILIAATLTVGGKVLAGGKSRLTADLIRQSDVSIEQFITDLGDLPNPLVLAPNPDGVAGSRMVVLPMVDGVDMSGSAPMWVNSMGLFIQEASRQGMTSLFDGIPSEYLVRWDGDSAVYEDSVSGTYPNRQPELRTVVDAWGRPLRFVHPAFDGLLTQESLVGNSRSAGTPGGLISPVQGVGSGSDFVLPSSRIPTGYMASDFTITDIRRDRFWTRGKTESTPASDDYDVTPDAIGDSDGGICVNDRPYVYSAGADGDPSTYTDKSRDVEGDNVYGNTQPRYSQERPN